MVPGHTPPPPGGHHGDVALKTCVLNLGSGLRPVARALARGGVRAWPLLGEGAGSKMLIFATFIRIFAVTEVTAKTLCFQWFFMVPVQVPSQSASIYAGIANTA